MTTLTPLIIIPARGGSKGIPHKNIKPLGGRPLIAYSIEVARDAARAFGWPMENIMVSTDSEEIAAVAESEGCPVPYRRPDHLATDTSGSREMMLDAMEWATARGLRYNCILLLQPTSPFRTVEDIEKCMQLFEKENPDMVVSVKETSANPYYNCFEADPATGALHMSKGDGLLTRRQDAPKAWEFNGAVYVISPDSLRRLPMGRFPRRLPVEMPAERSVDLDTRLDWAVAEALIAMNREEGGQA